MIISTLSMEPVDKKNLLALIPASRSSRSATTTTAASHRARPSTQQGRGTRVPSHDGPARAWPSRTVARTLTTSRPCRLPLRRYYWIQQQPPLAGPGPTRRKAKAAEVALQSTSSWQRRIVIGHGSWQRRHRRRLRYASTRRDLRFEVGAGRGAGVARILVPPTRVLPLLPCSRPAAMRVRDACCPLGWEIEPNPLQINLVYCTDMASSVN
jgi:hypothetical protein